MRMINADALKEALCENCMFNTKDLCGANCDAQQMIENAPTIEAEPVRHGRWVYADKIGGMMHYSCTSCKSDGKECIADENEITWFKFCPKCGARMNGGAENG